MEKNYEEYLEKLYKEVKPVKVEKGRFEIPKVEGHIEGNKTIISNFSIIASSLRRKQEHLKKFLSRELATPAIIESNRLVMNRKISKGKIDEKIRDYVNEFVLCKECKKPDTELVKENNFMFIHCLACGAKHSIRAKI